MINVWTISCYYYYDLFDYNMTKKSMLVTNLHSLGHHIKARIYNINEISTQAVS